MLIQETLTSLSAAEVIRLAVDFFQAGSRHATGVERRGETFVRFRADVGTVLVAALPGPDGATRVRATSARQWGRVGRFLVLLGEAGDVGSEQRRRGVERSRVPAALGRTAPAERLAAD